MIKHLAEFLHTTTPLLSQEDNELYEIGVLSILYYINIRQHSKRYDITSCTAFESHSVSMNSELR